MDLNIASGVAEDVVRHPKNYGLPTITSATPTHGGVVHFVWRLETEEGRFYLKIRGNKFAKIPEITTSPGNIVYEFKALTLLGNLMPNNFPQVIYFDPGRALLITSDAMPDGIGFEALLQSRKVTPDTVQNLGKTLREIHGVASTISQSIRENDDDAFYMQKLSHKLGHSDHPVLSNVIKDLTFNQPRQIILGDPSPKNIGVNNYGTRLVFFDLEDVHQGNMVFDVGFLLGHLILHAYTDEHEAIVHVDSFLNGYRNNYLDNLLLRAIALGTIMYRLNSIVPYSITLSDQQKAGLLQATAATLTIPDLGSLSWPELILLVFRERGFLPSARHW